MGSVRPDGGGEAGNHLGEEGLVLVNIEDGSDQEENAKPQV